MTTLFDPIRFGAIACATRVVMAPLTRCRAPGQVPTPLMATYYAQRADPATGAGLIVSEATPVAAEGHGYPDTPGLHTDAQARAWRVVTDAVHARGGRIVCQIWHVGRISHEAFQPGGAAPVSSTARASGSKVRLPSGEQVPAAVPRALRDDELPGIVRAFGDAADRAMNIAGFDGVEVHAANGYLIEQFLRDAINDRSGPYGGSRTNRMRLLAEVMAAVTAAAGADRTGIRLSPVTPANGAAQDSDPQGLYEAVVDALPQGLAYVHVIEGQTGGARDFAPFDFARLRARFDGPWIVNNGYDRTLALDAVASGRADAVAFGKPFIANPDLGRRLRDDNAPLAAPDSKRFYGGGADGYTDYPTLDALPA